MPSEIISSVHSSAHQVPLQQLRLSAVGTLQDILLCTPQPVPPPMHRPSPAAHGLEAVQIHPFQRFSNRGHHLLHLPKHQSSLALIVETIRREKRSYRHTKVSAGNRKKERRNRFVKHRAKIIMKCAVVIPIAKISSSCPKCCYYPHPAEVWEFISLCLPPGERSTRHLLRKQEWLAERAFRHTR